MAKKDSSLPPQLSSYFSFETFFNRLRICFYEGRALLIFWLIGNLRDVSHFEV
jgi:hypothetical protein